MKRIAATIKLLAARLWSNVMVRRFVHTFWQSFLAVFVLGIPLVLSAVHAHGVSGGKQALISLLTAAVAAGLAALRTAVMNIYEARKSTP